MREYASDGRGSGTLAGERRLGRSLLKKCQAQSRELGLGEDFTHMGKRSAQRMQSPRFGPLSMQHGARKAARNRAEHLLAPVGECDLRDVKCHQAIRRTILPNRSGCSNRAWAAAPSASGKVLSMTGRRTNEVYAINTTSGRLLARIKVGAGPHGLCVWPQPGRYSLGHTGILR